MCATRISATWACECGLDTPCFLCAAAMAKKLGKKIPKVEEITLYYAMLYDLAPNETADLRNAMREFGEDIGAIAHDSVRAKAQVLSLPAETVRARRRPWFMEAVHATREERNRLERIRRRERIAKADDLARRQARNAARKAGRPNVDG